MTLFLGKTVISPVINVGGGSVTPSAKYKLLQRVIDDSNNEIGTVSGFFTDANDVEYAVVCLDATYRNSSAQWASAAGNVTNMPLYYNWSIWNTKETATKNTQLILDYCTANGLTSSACTHCRQYSFTIGGITYYGQLPNIIELIDIVRHSAAINTADTSASSNTSLNFSTGRNCWSSTQYNSGNAWFLNGYGSIINVSKSSNYFAVPVLEIPN